MLWSHPISDYVEHISTCPSPTFSRKWWGSDCNRWHHCPFHNGVVISGLPEIIHHFVGSQVNQASCCSYWHFNSRGCIFQFFILCVLNFHRANVSEGWWCFYCLLMLFVSSIKLSCNSATEEDIQDNIRIILNLYVFVCTLFSKGSI